MCLDAHIPIIAFQQKCVYNFQMPSGQGCGEGALGCSGVRSGRFWDTRLRVH